MKNGSLSFKQLPCQDILYKVIHFCIHKISGENMRSTNWSHLFGIGAFLWNPQYGDSFFAHKVLGKWVHLISHVSPYFTFFQPKLVSPFDSFFAHKSFGKWVHLISHFSPYFTFFQPKLVSPFDSFYLPNYCSGTGFNQFQLDQFYPDTT